MHALKSTDYQKRQDFAETILARIAADPAYLNKICFTDEVGFIGTMYGSGAMRTHMWYRSMSGTRQNSMFGVVFFHDQVIGPYFFEGETIRQEFFLEMLIHFVHPRLRPRQCNMIFQLG